MIILDTGAVTALAAGHRALLRLADNAAGSPFNHLMVPALCLMEAEAQTQDAGAFALALPAIEIEPLDSVAAVTVAVMVRDGIGAPDTCHALYTSLPTGSRGTMHVILTDQEQVYPPGTITVHVDDPRLLG
ncbi:hypothetical protein [Kitasatospora sp. NPDC059571]|uniref:hypothetical protein n=1 Tax=Kitasatospora sp. NPDC059571 TaxID=3346871 RepID=UPI0036ABA0BF